MSTFLWIKSSHFNHCNHLDSTQILDQKLRDGVDLNYDFCKNILYPSFLLWFQTVCPVFIWNFLVFLSWVICFHQRCYFFYLKPPCLFVYWVGLIFILTIQAKLFIISVVYTWEQVSRDWHLLTQIVEMKGNSVNIMFLTLTTLILFLIQFSVQLVVI